MAKYDAFCKKFGAPPLTDIEHKIIFCVGNLVAEWANCETLFYGAFEILAGKKDSWNASVLWLSQRNTRARLDLMLHLAKVSALSPASVEELRKQLVAFSGVTRARNFFCHSHYRIDATRKLLSIDGADLDAAGWPIKFKRKSADNGVVNEIIQTIEKIGVISIDTFKLVQQLRVELGALHIVLPEPPLEYR